MNKLVIAFGTFDYLHAGHEQYLKKAKALGDELIVVIARDKTVKQIKGQPVAHHERKRAKAVRNLNIADSVILGYHKDKHKVLRKYRPNIIALGYDQFVFTQKLRKTLIDLKLDAKIIRIEAHFPQVYKSSILRNLAEKENEPEKETASKTATIN
ncbi:adenylyltransferase/cytidyltransferase family protein [Patescibacteria group bacterium]|nr:adenylyltransferase/cytidyltransferase family protein [Patescibacteria group bacterium]MBU1703006.1 adenylyltransferase/cytidyltransferase family protein [Patescibacteria group bacterium]MBU1954038.1 adenylyltransferase/cytidyltransferase family protein [Patescibacteria group bacterium]